MKTSSKYMPSLTAIVCAVAAISMVLATKTCAAEPPRLQVDDSPLPEEARPTLTFNTVVKKAAASVVNIYTTRNPRGGGESALAMDPFFRRFFGANPDDQPREQRSQALGSGVIVSTDGYIITANHVVEGADEIKVALADESTTFTAKLIGNDPKTEVAVIKVEGNNLPAITLANSDKVVVGDVVLAIGNPFGLGQTVTMGIVSATGRSGMGIVDYEDFIQTDASINPGNSGGALVDGLGRLVGLNTAILSRSGGNQGVGFAVPVNLARLITERLVTYGKVTRGHLGVMIQPITPELAKEFKLPDTFGTLVGGVSPGSPAERAGIKEGDVITAFNGRKVTNSRLLRLMAAQTLPNTTVPVQLMRDGQQLTVDVKLAEAPDESVAREDRDADRNQGGSAAGVLEGVALSDLGEAVRRQLNLPAQLRGGAVVTQISPGAAAAAAGLQEGDVILEINRQKVDSANDAVELSRQAEGDRVLLRVWSGGSSRFLVVNPDPGR